MAPRNALPVLPALPAVASLAASASAPAHVTAAASSLPSYLCARGHVPACQCHAACKSACIRSCTRFRCALSFDACPYRACRYPDRVFLARVCLARPPLIAVPEKRKFAVLIDDERTSIEVMEEAIFCCICQAFQPMQLHSPWGITLLGDEANHIKLASKRSASFMHMSGKLTV